MLPQSSLVISSGMEADGTSTARIERALSFVHLVQASEAIPTAAVERALSEVGVPGAKEPPH